MSVIVVGRPSVRNDLNAFGRHLRARLALLVREPLSIGTLTFAGVVTIALWHYSLGLSPGFANQYPWPAGFLVYSGPPPTAVRLAVYVPHPVEVLGLLFWAALVASPLRPGSASSLRTGSAGWALPGLPLGPRARLLADCVAVTAILLLARLLVFGVFGRRLAPILFGHGPWVSTYPGVYQLVNALMPASWQLAAQTTRVAEFVALKYALNFVVATLLGTLLLFPVVLAWRTIARFDARGLWKPALVLLLLVAAISVGAMAHPSSALPISALACALLLARLDDGSRPDASAFATLRFQAVRDPRVQFRRDAWLGAFRGRPLLLALAVGLPLLFSVLASDLLGLVRTPDLRLTLRGVAFSGALLQWLGLMGLALMPFGVVLIPAAPSSNLFSGGFIRSWGVLPVPREKVIRTLYLHALLASLFAWLVLCLQALLLRVRFSPLLYELPIVFLVAGLVVCEALGDRRRGLLAIWALASFQMAVPIGFRLLPSVFGDVWEVRLEGAWLGVSGYTVALVGILPPLVHLRGRRVVAPAVA